MIEENKNKKDTLYELGFHVVSSLSEEEAMGEVSNIKKKITDYKAEVLKEGKLELIDLAYTIVKKIAGNNTKFNKSYFTWVKFYMNKENIELFKKDLDINENILRYLIIKTVDDDEHSTSKVAEDEKVEKDSKPEAKRFGTAKETRKTSDKEEVVSDEKGKEEEKGGVKEVSPKKDKDIDEAIDEITKEV